MAGYKYKGKDRDVLEAPREPLEAAQPVPEGHGTYAGWKRHKRAGTDVCDPCRLAYNAYMAKRRGTTFTGRKNNRSPVCGTNAGFRAHERRGEPIDQACRKAHNEYQNERRALKRAAEAKAVPDNMVTIGEAMEGLLVDLEQRRDSAEGVAA